MLSSGNVGGFDAGWLFFRHTCLMNHETPGARIKALRKRTKKLTISEVADAVGISRPHLSMIETDNDLPGRATLDAIATHFGVSVDYILHGGDATPKTPRTREVVEDPDELALLDFWRELDDDERSFMLKRLNIPPGKNGSSGKG